MAIPKHKSTLVELHVSYIIIVTKWTVNRGFEYWNFNDHFSVLQNLKVKEFVEETKTSQ